MQKRNKKIKPEGKNKSMKEYNIVDVVQYYLHRHKRETNFKINLHLLEHNFNVTMKSTLQNQGSSYKNKDQKIQPKTPK